jgi:hypothetical protein
MSQPTESEILFEGFCKTLSIPCDRIACASTKTPDYDVTLGGHRIVAEVKQIEPGDDDRELLATGAGWSEPGRRVRSKIQASSKQLKARSDGTLPALLVVYDHGTMSCTDQDDIKTAMFGEEIVVIRRLDGEPISASRVHPGGHRKCTPTDNTSISAIGLMYRFGGNDVRLSVFHNHFAAIRIDPDWFRAVGIFRHFAIDPMDSNSPYEWREV